MDPNLIAIIVGGAVILLIGGAGLVFSKSLSSEAEQRLDGLSGKMKTKADAANGILLRPEAIDIGNMAFWSKLVPNVDNVNRLYEQADVNIPFNRFMAIAGVLAMDPEILVLDEPTTFLDPPGQRELVTLLRELPQAKLLVTHDIEFARALASRAVFFDHGRVAGEGPVDEIIERFHWSFRSQ